MRVNSSIKAEILILKVQGKYDEIIKKLQKIKMSATEYDCLDTEIFINQTMAKVYHQKGNKEFANRYLEYNKKIFENQEVFEDRRFEYYDYLWLYSDVNKDDMTREEYYKNFMEIYRYFDDIDDDNFCSRAIKNIIFDDNKKEKIISFLKSVIDEYRRDDKMIQNMVANCKELDCHIYIILNSYLYANDEIAI